jgi:Ran GTPase-activating protein (RanGAP) involved in mRNA processing and transport
MQRNHENKHFTLERTIETLNANNPEFKEFHLNSIIMNPTQDEWQDGELFTVSHIRDEDLFQLAEALEKNNTLETIAIDGTDSSRSLEWTDAGAKAVGESIKNHPKLKNVKISMQTYDLDEIQISGFLHCLTGSANIEHLSLSVYCDTIHFLNTLGNLLLSKQKSLKSIYIQGSSFRVSHLPEIETSLETFAMGLGSQKELQHINFQFLNVHDSGIAKFADTMQEITSLKSLELQGCKIRNGVKHICSMAKNNPALEHLDLGYNSLSELGAKELITALHLFKNLKFLGLNKVNLTNTALDYLVSTYAEKKLNFPSLCMSSHKMDDCSIELIIKLIDGNIKLKKLVLDFCDITDKHIKKLEPLLSDPLRCQLESFSFSGNQPLSLTTYNKLLTILDKNELIYNLLPPRQSSEHRVVNNINWRKKQLREWDMYIWSAICLLNAYGLKSNELHDRENIASIPLETIYLILSFISPHTPHVQANSVVLCTDLIKNNLELRRTLIDEKKYSPIKGCKNDETQSISQWWSSSINDSKNNKKILFFHSSIVRPNFMKLKDILAELKPILRLANNESNMGTETKVISFNISKFDLHQQIHIRNLFTRFLEIEYSGYLDIQHIPTADVHAETGILTITGTTLAELKEQFVRSLKPPVQESNHCRMM